MTSPKSTTSTPAGRGQERASDGVARLLRATSEAHDDVAQVKQPDGDLTLRIDHADSVAHVVMSWFAEHARPLPWRTADTGPWGVLVSEFMAQQTPVARVAPQWQTWMQRWPRPSDLAAAAPADVLNAWDRLGYPRRALRLHATAAAIALHHKDQVPQHYDELLALPGIGDYTAAAVLAFAFGRRAIVMDTNVRRVVSRVFTGQALPRQHIVRAERALVDAVMPGTSTAENPHPIDAAAAQWSVAVMELGALVCTPTPDCEECPLTRHCTWRAVGYPASPHPSRRPQPFHGTDRHVRGRIMKALRDAWPAALSHADLEHVIHGEVTAREHTPVSQFERALASLLTDGLVETTKGGQISLPTSSPTPTD